MTETPLLSVVVNTYDRLDSLPRALDSVLGQAPPDVEVLVADDGSTQPVGRFVRETYGDRVGWFTHENAGLSAARNLGWRAARGSFVMFLDDDDELAPGALEAIMGLLALSDVGIASGSAEQILGDASARVRAAGPLGPSMADIEGQYLAGSFAIRRDVLEAVGGFDEGLFCSHQFELFLRAGPYCASHGLATLVTDRVILRQHVDDASQRGRNRPERLFRCAVRIIEHHRGALGTDPGRYADLLGVAGVAAMRARHPAEARRLLFAAAKTEPRRAKGWTRLAVSLVPPVANRVWG